MQTLPRNYSYERGRRLAMPHQKKPKLPYGTLTIAIGCLVFIGALTKVFFFTGNDNNQSPAVLAAGVEQEQPIQQPEPPKRMVDTAGLEASLAQIVKNYPYDTSISVVDLNSGKLIQAGDSAPFIAASTTKLLSAIVYLKDVEDGNSTLDTLVGGLTAREQIKLALVDSDNNAWAALNEHLSKSEISKYAQTQGYTSYDASRNTITSNDMATLMADVYNRKLLNGEHTDLLLSWMQNTSEERFIPSAVPEGMSVYHKAGYLAERVHDAAIIDNGSAPFVIVIYSKSFTDSYDYSVGQRLFQQATQEVIRTFE